MVKVAYLKPNSSFETFYLYPLANEDILNSVLNRKIDKNNLDFLMTQTRTSATMHPNNITYTLGKLNLFRSNATTIHQWYSIIKDNNKLSELFELGKKDKYVKRVIELVHSVMQRTFDERHGIAAFAFSDFADNSILPNGYEMMNIDEITCYYKTGFIPHELVSFYHNSKDLIAA